VLVAVLSRVERPTTTDPVPELSPSLHFYTTVLRAEKIKNYRKRGKYHLDGMLLFM
jgi:hypothetical protein